MQPSHPAIETQRYFDPAEIDAHLVGVEYIIMATPSPEEFKEAPIHFTIFLNTSDEFPDGIQQAIFQKFCAQYNITRTAEFVGGVGSVGFAQTKQETPMPMWLIKDEDRRAIPHVPLYVMDFLGDSDAFKEVKEQLLTGWSYSYA